MKIKNTFLILFGTMFYFGCNWQIPQKATVKASPTFNFSAGTIKNDLSEQINLDSIVDDMLESGSEQFRVYNYCPNEDAPKSFALKFSIAEVPVDFSEYIKNSGISDAISGLSFEQKISVPEISFNHTAKIDISEIKKGINKLVIYNNLVFPDTENGFILDFSKIVYKNCTINITGSIPNGTCVTIESDRKDIHGYIDNNTCSIKVSDFTIDSDNFYVTFGDNKDYPYLITVNEDSEIASVHDVTSPEISFPFEMSFSLSDANSTNFESCEIADGKLITDLTVPSTWSGVSVDYDFTSTGGIEVNADKNGNLEKEISLKNTTISNKKTTSNSDIEISLNDATLDFANEVEAMQIEISSEIKELKSLCIELDDVETNINYSEKLPQEVIDSVKQINLNSLTLNVEYTNTFPEGNDIKLNTKSDIFNIDDSITLYGGRENQTEKITSTDKNEIKLGDGGYDSYDFTGKLTLPGATSEKPNRILISNVALGEDYFISLKLTPEIDWESIFLSDKLTDSMSQEGKMNLPVNINELIKNMSSSFKIDDLLKKVQLDSLPIYLYCTKPTFEDSKEDPFENITFNGKISIYYGTEDQAEFPETIIQDNTTPIDFQNYPKIKFSSDRKKILSDFKETTCSIKADLADIINKSLSSTSENSSLFVDYNLSLDGGTDDGIEIRSEMLSDGGSLGIFAYVVLPLKFKTVSNITLDATELAGNSLNGDIFGRKDANSDMNDLEQYIDYIKKASFNYQITQLPFNTNKNAVKLNAGLILGEGNNSEKITLTEKSSLQSGTISIKSDDIKKVLKSYPANLDLQINIDKGTEFSIPQQMNLELNLAISIETDIEMEF